MNRILSIGLLLACAASSVFAGSYTLSMNTTGFVTAGTPPKPFYLDFLLISNESPTANVITISNLAANGVTGLFSSQNGGAYSSPVATLSSTGFVNEVILNWTPLTTLNLTIDIGTSVSGVTTPDSFQFNIIYTTPGCNPATNCPFVETTDSLASSVADFDISSTGAKNIATYGSSNGGTVTFAAPTLTAITTVPEPTTFAMMAIGGLALLLARRKRA